MYFNVRVFASQPFKITRPKMNYNFSDSVEIPNMPGGGIPTCPEFYRNPQIVVCADKDKLKTADAKKPFEALFTYKTHNPNT